MEKHERSDPTFPIFIVLASIFIVVLMVVNVPASRWAGNRVIERTGGNEEVT